MHMYHLLYAYRGCEQPVTTPSPTREAGHRTGGPVGAGPWVLEDYGAKRAFSGLTGPFTGHWRAIGGVATWLVFLGRARCHFELRLFNDYRVHRIAVTPT